MRMPSRDVSQVRFEQLKSQKSDIVLYIRMSQIYHRIWAVLFRMNLQAEIEKGTDGEGGNTDTVKLLLKDIV